jgi:DNA-binding transcriptional LysR family regulator
MEPSSAEFVRDTDRLCLRSEPLDTNLAQGGDRPGGKMEQSSVAYVTPSHLTLRQISHLTLRQLSYFVTVAEERHFCRAAARLHISQPPLTQRIRALERDLGVPLFAREGNQIELTEAGRLVLVEAKATLAQVQRVREVALRAGRGEAGNLRVQFVISVPFLRAFREATDAFQRDHPSVVLDLVQTTSWRALEALRQGKTEICLIRRVAASHLNGAQQMVVARDRLTLVLPANHRKAHSEKVALSDLAEERFMGFAIENSVGLQRHIMDLWRRADLVPRICQRAENGPAMLALVAAGSGNAILPSTLSAIPMHNVLWKPIDLYEQWTSSSIVMLYRTDARNEMLQSRFVDYIGKYSSNSL